MFAKITQAKILRLRNENKMKFLIMGKECVNTGSRARYSAHHMRHRLDVVSQAYQYSYSSYTINTTSTNTTAISNNTRR